MGYDTNFEGEFNVTPPLRTKTKEFLIKLSDTRRMKRNLPERYGEEGEFYVDSSAMGGQDMRSKNIIHNSEPPGSQPGLWCQWRPNEDGSEIFWDGGEKFYYYVEWIEYLITKIFKPNGYVLNGSVKWQGDEMDDRGTINIENNVITIIDLE